MKTNHSIACSRRPPELLLRGIEQFNAGEYFACHESLEELWVQEKGAIRRLYQGILQIGVALLHRQGGNFRGAVNLLRRGTGYLEPFAPACLGVDLGRLLGEARRVLEDLESLGPDRAGEFDPALVPKIHLFE